MPNTQQCKGLGRTSYGRLESGDSDYQNNGEVTDIARLFKFHGSLDHGCLFRLAASLVSVCHSGLVLYFDWTYFIFKKSFLAQASRELSVEIISSAHLLRFKKKKSPLATWREIVAVRFP